jgi:hypothetical protein
MICNTAESERIYEAGGRVEYGRVNGISFLVIVHTYRTQILKVTLLSLVRLETLNSSRVLICHLKSKL